MFDDTAVCGRGYRQNNLTASGALRLMSPADWYLKARLKLKHLQLLGAIDDHRSLKRAAAAVSLSQPAASKLLGELEGQLQCDLFVRHARGVEPTLHGESLIRRARTILGELRQAGEELTTLSTGASGTIAVGTVTGPAVEILTPAIDTVLRAHPRLQISIQVDNSDALARAMLSSTIDFAVARVPKSIEPTLFAYEDLGEERISVICRKGHPLLRKRPVAISALRDWPWVMQPRGTLLRNCLDRLFMSHKVALPESIIETSSVLMAMSLVARTRSLAVIADSVASLYASPDRFVQLSIAAPLSIEPFGLMQLRDRRLSPAVKMLQEEIRTLAQGKNRKRPAR